MAQAFNLTAQLNLRGPANIRQIAAQIRRDLGNINATVKFSIDPTTTRNVAGLTSALKSLNSTLSATTKSASDAASAMRNFGNAVNSINIKNIPQQVSASAKAVASLDRASSSSTKALANASSEMVEFGKQAGLAVRRFAAFSAVTSVIYGITNSINQGVQAFIDYDRQLTRIQQVTGESAEGLTKLQSQITNLSTSFGVSSKELTNVALTLAQAGLSARDTERALKALALSSLAPSFDDMNETVEGSIALMRQFDISAKDLEQSLGAVNAVSAKFAVEASDIITAIQRTGSVFATASKGVSEGKDALNEFIAVFTSVRATTRESAETIATGLRTIFTRIQRGSTINALKEFGVNLTDAQGKFVGAYKAVELLSQGLSKIDPRSLDFSRIIEELGGFRQIGKVIPLIQQFAVAQDALSVAQQGQGSLARDAVTAQRSLANQISKVREEFLALFREIGSSKSFQTIVRGALDLTSALIKVTSSLKGLMPALSILLAFKGVKALTQFTAGLSGGLRRGPDNKEGSGSAPLFNRGGTVRKFARGGLVPGQGDGDTVPAMLEPGEFVIRKKAVATIGAHNLHNMNQYASGGTIRRGSSSNRKRFAKGGAAQLASIDGDQTAIDGDTFTATVTPKAKQFTASFRISDFDTYETGNKTSRVSEAKAIQLLEIKKNKRKKAPQPSDSGYKIPSTYNVTEDLTASKAAELGKQALQQQIQGFKDVSKVKVGGGFGRYLASGFSMDGSLTTGRKWGANGKLEEFAFGGKVKKFAAGGRALRNIGYIDYDIIANEANKDIVEKGMLAAGVTGPRLYADYLTQLAVKARKDKNLDKLRAIYGVAGSGKTTLARGQGTDKARLRQTNRFPVLTPEDIQKASEILVLSSSVSRTKMDDFFGAADRTYTLSSTTKAEQERIKSQRASRDVTGIGLEGRQPGVTSGVSTDTAVGEALLGDALGKKSVVLGRSGSGRLRRKSGKELVDVVKKKIAFTWGGFAPTTSGHESIMDASAAMGFAPEDFIALVGANEGIKAGDPSSYRTAVFDQDFRVLLAKAGFGARGATVLPKPRDFEVPQAFDISREGADRRQVLIPKKGSRAFVADKTPEQTAKYKEAGYAVSNIERTGGISGTMVRDLIMAGDMAKLQKVLSPGVYELVSDNIGRLRNRANALPDIIEQVRASSGVSLADIDKEIESLGIKRIDSKKVASDPEYAAKAQLLEELRSKKKKIQSAASFEPYRLLAQLAKAQPDKYGLNTSISAPALSGMSGVSKLSTTQMKNMGGLIRQFEDAGAVSATAGRALSRAEILKVLGTDGAAKAAGISSTQVYALLGLRSPDEKQKALREAIEKEYIKKVNRKAGAAQATTTKLQNRGLEFGAAGLFGKAFAPENIDIQSDKLSRSAKVRVLSGVMKQSAAEKIESIFQAGSQNLAQQAADAIRGEYGESGSATGSSIFNANTEASIQGGLLEKAIQMLGGPGATKGQGFDFPNGLQGAAKYFGLPGDIPTDLKRTLDGASTIKDNIVTYLKNVMGYASGGQVDRLTFEDIRKQIMDKYPDIDFRISKRKKGRGFGYNLLGALKTDGGLLKSKGLKFEQPSNLQQLIESSDKIAQILLNPKEFALGGLADSSGEMSSLIASLYGNRSNNEKTSTKKEKQFGKIALRSDGQSISATYFKNDQRSGNVSAYKMRDYLYYVGLSQATSGYGPRLYDAVMEEATAKGAMLTSDRSSVSGDAKKVWEYYFRNRGDVKKTPLKPDDWTRNQADIDPKLFGKEDTWPPATDPAWILQSGYSKSPSLINDPTAVIRMGDQNDSRSMALEYFQRKALGGLIRKFAKGGAAEDTVPALLTPGEFVINKQAAQKIGYNKLAKLNNADKVQGYNAGGIVGGIAHFAAGGGVGIPMFDWLSKLAKSYDRRPDTVSRATVGVDTKTLDGVKELIKALNEMGISAQNTAEILNAGGRTSYKEIEKAMKLDIERLRIAGASVDTIIAAERRLAEVRNKRKTDVKQRQTLEGAFRGVSGRSSGSVQQEIVARANRDADARIKEVQDKKAALAPKIEAAETKKIIDAKREEYIDKTYEKRRRAEERKKGGPLDDKESRKLRYDIESKASKKKFDLTEDEQKKVKDTIKEQTSVSDETRKKIKERAAVNATVDVTGISRDELKKQNLGGDAILKYASESMRDRKTLAEMDKQLLEMKLEEKRNSAEYIAASASEQRAMLDEARKAANEEISIRREMINKMAEQNGEMGVGAAGMTDWRNSPILNAVKDRYVAKKGEASLLGLKDTALSDVGLAAGIVGGQGKNIANLMYDTSTESGQKQAAATGAGIEQAGTTLSAGLMAASQALTIPVVGPWIAGLTALGTVAFTAVDYMFDFTGAQKAAVLELEKALNATKLEDATDKLDKAFSDFESDMSNLDLQAALGKAFSERNVAAQGSAITDLKDAQVKVGNSRSWLEWAAGASKPEMEQKDYRELARSQAQANSIAASQAKSYVRSQINTGMSLQDITQTDTGRAAIEAYGLGNADIQDETNKELVRRFGDLNKVTEDQRKSVLMGIATRAFLNDKEMIAAVKAAELAKAMEDADRAGRKLAQSFSRLFSSIDQSINRIKFESDQRKKLADARAAGLNGRAELVSGVSEVDRTVNILDNRNAYTPEEYQKAVAETTAMVPGEAGTRLREATMLDATLGDKLNASIAAAVKNSANTDVSTAAQTAKDAGFAQINSLNVSEEIKKTLRDKLEADINAAETEANKDASGKPERALEIFTEKVGNAANGAGQFVKGAQEATRKLAELKAAEFAKFVEGINESAKAAQEAATLFKKSRDLMAQGQRTVKEVLTGQSESYADVKGRMMGDVAALTGGITDPTAIRQKIVDMSGQLADKTKKATDAKAASLADPENAKLADDAKKAATEARDFAVELNRAKEGLDMLAESTELVNKALDDLKAATQMQAQRENFVNQLLTNTPEEADKLNQTFIRLQRNLSGGLNNAFNQRDARKAYNDTLRQTGNVREATRAGNTVLANQRKETLALMKDSGFRATIGLQMGMQNPNVSDAQIDQKLKDMELQLMKQMAVESGMMNNPLVQQAIKAKENERNDPIAAARADRYLEAVGLQAKATKEQAELKAIDSTEALTASNAQLIQALNDLKSVVEAATGRDAAIEGGKVDAIGRPIVPMNNGAAPLAKGGIVYASAGRLINFEPKGTDTVPAMLSPGEFVINAQATAQHLPLLQAINDGQANVVSKGLSKGGLVYLAKGGQLKKDETIAQDRAALDAEVQAQGANYGVSQADQQEAIRLRDARVAAEQEEMFLADGAMVDHSARHWTEHQFGAEWGKMTEEQQNTEIQKNLPRFQQLGQDYTTRRDAYVAQKGAEDEATGLWSKDRFTTENQHAFFRKEKERSGATYAAASQAEYDQQTKIRESNKTSQASARAELDRRQRVEDARQIAYGEKEVFAPTKKVSVDGKGNVTMVDWKPGEREAYIESRKKEAIDIVNKEEAKQGLPLTQYQAPNKPAATSSISSTQTAPSGPITYAQMMEARRAAYNQQQAAAKEYNKAFRASRSTRPASDPSQENTAAQQWYDSQNFTDDNLPTINGRVATPLQAYRMQKRLKDQDDKKTRAFFDSVDRGPLGPYQTTASNQGKDPITGRTWTNERVRLGAGIPGANNDKWEAINNPTPVQAAVRSAMISGYQAMADVVERQKRLRQGASLEDEIASGVSEDSLTRKERDALEEYRIEKMFEEGRQKDKKSQEAYDQAQRSVAEAKAGDPYGLIKAKRDADVKAYDDARAKGFDSAEDMRQQMETFGVGAPTTQAKPESFVEKAKRKQRERLGLSPDASDQEVKDTIASPGLAMKPAQATTTQQVAQQQKDDAAKLIAERDIRLRENYQKRANDSDEPRWVADMSTVGQDKKPDYNTDQGVNPAWVFPESWDATQKSEFFQKRQESEKVYSAQRARTKTIKDETNKVIDHYQAKVQEAVDQGMSPDEIAKRQADVTRARNDLFLHPIGNVPSGMNPEANDAERWASKSYRSADDYFAAQGATLAYNEQKAKEARERKNRGDVLRSTASGFISGMSNSRVGQAGQGIGEIAYGAIGTGVGGLLSLGSAVTELATGSDGEFTTNILEGTASYAGQTETGVRRLYNAWFGKNSGVTGEVSSEAIQKNVEDRNARFLENRADVSSRLSGVAAANPTLENRLIAGAVRGADTIGEIATSIALPTAADVVGKVGKGSRAITNISPPKGNKPGFYQKAAENAEENFTRFGFYRGGKGPRALAPDETRFDRWLAGTPLGKGVTTATNNIGSYVRSLSATDIIGSATNKIGSATNKIGSSIGSLMDAGRNTMSIVGKKLPLTVNRNPFPTFTKGLTNTIDAVTYLPRQLYKKITTGFANRAATKKLSSLGKTTAATSDASRVTSSVIPPVNVTGVNSPQVAAKIQDNVVQSQEAASDIMIRYASSPEKAKEIMANRDRIFKLDTLTIDPSLGSKVNVVSKKAGGVGGEFRPGRSTIAYPTVSMAQSRGAAIHEMFHNVQDNVSNIQAATNPSARFRWFAKNSLDTIRPQMEEFLRPGGAYDKLVSDLGGGVEGVGFYKGSDILNNNSELLTSLTQAEHTEAFRNNPEAQDMLRSVIKAMGFSRGGLVYLADGGWTSKSPVLPSTAGAVTSAVALGGLKGNIGYGIGMGVDNAFGFEGTGAMVGSAADIGVGAGIGTAKAANTLRAAGTALISSAGASSLASAAGTGLAVGYGAYAVSDLAGEAAALATGQTNLADYDKENRRQANQSYITNVGENIARPGRAAIQLGVETSGLVSDVAEARAASRKLYEKQLAIQESKDFAQAMMTNGTFNLASSDSINTPQGFLTLDNKRVPQNASSGVDFAPQAMMTGDTFSLASPQRVPQNRSSGGIIYANNGALALAQGTDTVPAMLTPGEFVVNREAAQTYMPILHAINSGHFNRGGIVNYLANGGVVAPKYYAEGTQFPIQRPSSGGGVSNNVGIDIGAAISQALGSAVGQLSEFASNLTTGLQQTMEQYGQVSQTISQSVATFSESANKMESSAQTYGEAAANTPSKLVATVTGSVMTNHTGLDKLTGNIEKDIYSNTAKQSSTISQNSIAHVDKTAYEGGLNSAANAKPMGMA